MAVRPSTPATIKSDSATAPAVSQIHGLPDLNQSRMLCTPIR